MRPYTKHDRDTCTIAFRVISIHNLLSQNLGAYYERFLHNVLHNMLPLTFKDHLGKGPGSFYWYHGLRINIQMGSLVISDPHYGAVLLIFTPQKYWPQGYKALYMLNSTGHGISTAHKT